jgi:hypothetical protein
MNIKTNRIVPLIGAAAAMVAIAAAPVASAQTNGSQVTPNTGNAQIVATPGVAAQEAAQMQEPFGGDMGALLFHHN